MFRLYWKYYVQALLKVLCSGFAVIQVLYSLSKKDLIRMSYPINMAFWLDNFGVRVWNTLKFRNCEAPADSLGLMLLPCFSIIITNSALEYIKFTMESKSITEICWHNNNNPIKSVFFRFHYAIYRNHLHIHNCQPFSKVCKMHARGEGWKKSTILAYAFFVFSGFFPCLRSSVLFYCCFACISFVRLNIKRNQTPMWYLILTPIISLSLTRQTTLFGNVLPKQNRIYNIFFQNRQTPIKKKSILRTQYLYLKCSKIWLFIFMPGIWKWLMYTFWGGWGVWKSVLFAHFGKWLTIMDDP